MNSNLYRISILTGGIKTGKTTKLSEWIKNKRNAGGILVPVINSGRYLQIIKTGELILFEAEYDGDEDKIISIGNYRFSAEVFRKARETLIDDFIAGVELLIIDEIGFLELRGTGLEPAVSEIIGKRDSYAGQIILIVRDNLLSEVKKHYGLKESEINYLNL